MLSRRIAVTRRRIRQTISRKIKRYTAAGRLKTRYDFSIKEGPRRIAMQQQYRLAAAFIDIMNVCTVDIDKAMLDGKQPWRNLERRSLQGINLPSVARSWQKPTISPPLYERGSGAGLSQSVGCRRAQILARRRRRATHARKAPAGR